MDDKLAVRRAVRETVLLSVVFLFAVFLFVTTVYFVATREAAHELQNRPRGLILGWLTTIAVGLLLGKTRQHAAAALPKALIVVRESLQSLMLLLFGVVLSYTAYFLYTARGLALQRPWSLLVGWFAFLVFILFCVKTRAIVQAARRK